VPIGITGNDCLVLVGCGKLEVHDVSTKRKKKAFIYAETL